MRFPKFLVVVEIVIVLAIVLNALAVTVYFGIMRGQWLITIIALSVMAWAIVNGVLSYSKHCDEQ